MEALREAFAATGEPWGEPTAWQTHCDASIYHHRGYPTAIFGAGRLDKCLSEDEYIDIPELQRALAISALATWALAE